MSLPKLEVGIGAIDGVNTTFFTPTAFVPSSVRLYLNGQLLQESCLSETDPATGEVELLELPRTGDVVQLFYLDGSAGGIEVPSELRCPLSGTLTAQVNWSGSLQAERAFGGILESSELSGSVSSEVALLGELSAPQGISGRLEVCHG